MEIQIRCQPSYAAAFLILDHGETVLAERGALVAMSAGVDAGASAGSGGIGRAAMRKAFGGENFFMGRYTATAHQAWVALAPGYPGDICAVDVHEGSDSLFVQQGSFLAGGPGVNVDVRYGGVKTVVMREGITTLHVHGEGQALLSSYGGLLPFTLSDDEVMVVDTGHLVAWSAGTEMKLGLLGGAVASAATGEGVVATMVGPGRVWIQTRSEGELSSWLFPNPSERR
jgi:uncharacterized protein (TIGR00266 family)